MNGKSTVCCKKSLTVAFMILVVIALFVGCKGEEADPSKKVSDRALKIAYIDSDKLLEDYPEYKSFKKKKETEGRQILKKVENAKKLGTKVSDEDRRKIKELTNQFLANEKVILKKFVESVREASIQVKNEKKYDMVLNNAATRPIVEFGGVDITEDVQVKMVELRKEGNSSEKEKKEKK